MKHQKTMRFRNKITGEIREISRHLFNSALVSAQNRQRYYWTNIPNVQQPADRGILLKDILESATSEKGYAFALNDIDGKARTVRATCYKDGIRNLVANNIDRRTCVAEPICLNSKSGRAGVDGLQPSLSDRIYSIDGKATAVTNGFMPKIAEPTRIGDSGSNSQGDRVYSPYGKTYPVYEVKSGLIEIKGKTYPIKLPDGYYIIRKLTVNECRRLQTIPDWYKMPCSASQNYKMLGNGWTIEVIKHILSYIPNIADCTVEVLSMYDGMSCGQITLAELGCQVERYVSYEIDKYAIQTTQANFQNTEQRGDAFQLRKADWNY